jgi:hypothetical protein
MTADPKALLQYLLNDETRSAHVTAALVKMMEGVLDALRYEQQAHARRQAMIEAELQQGRSPTDGHEES